MDHLFSISKDSSPKESVYLQLLFGSLINDDGWWHSQSTKQPTKILGSHHASADLLEHMICIITDKSSTILSVCNLGP